MSDAGDNLPFAWRLSTAGPTSIRQQKLHVLAGKSCSANHRVNIFVVCWKCFFGKTAFVSMEECMRSWTMKCLFLMMAALLVVPVSAAAQDTQGKVGVGLSFLGDEGGTGFTVDYSKPFRSMANNRTLGWVGDFSFHRNSFDGLGFEGDITSLTFQGGVRFSGPAGQNEKLTWHVQGLVGILRQSFDFGTDDVTDELCDELGLDCDDFDVGDSDTGVIFTPGGGIDYWFNERTSFRAQLDIPIGEGGSTTRFWIGISRRMGQ